MGYCVNISKNSICEGMNSIGTNAHFDGFLGFGSYISAHCDMAMTKIGKFTSVGPRVVVNPGRHPYTYPFVTTCPAFYSTRKQNSETFVNNNFYGEFNFVENHYVVKIGNDCWIGEGALITGGVTIGDGAVILAHAVVTKDVPPYAIVGGVPAKTIKYRYREDDIDFLLKFKWWDKPIEWMKENVALFLDIEELKNKSLEVQ